MLKIARAMLACRDPKMAGVTDDALYTVFEVLCKVATGENKYPHFFGYGGWSVIQDTFDNFQEFIAEWDAAYATQQAGQE
jgi:hypothetical protein